MIKPVGGHSPFLSKIHGIKDEHTSNKPNFKALYPEIRDVFQYPLVGHSLFDKQVLNALSEHFDLNLTFTYIDSCAIAKEKLPNLKNHKLKTLAQHFQLPAFKHHDAAADAAACANIFLKLNASENTEGASLVEEALFFKGMVSGVLADNEINYKEAYELLYWLEKHPMIGIQYKNIYENIKNVLSDYHLDSIEAAEIRDLLKNIQ